MYVGFTDLEFHEKNHVGRVPKFALLAFWYFQMRNKCT